MSNKQRKSAVPINRPTPPVPNQTADTAYYRGSVSAINNATALTRRGKPGTPLQTHRTPHQLENDTDTDRYYRSGGSRASQRGQPTGKITVPLEPMKKLKGGRLVPAGSRRDPNVARQPGTTRQVEGAGAVATPIRVRNKTEVAEAKDLIFAAIARGEPRVFVQVADAECERRVRAAIELGVAREQITEDRVRDVAIIPMTSSGEELAKQMFGEVKLPDAVEQVEKGQIGNGADIDDFDKYVKGDTDEADDVNLAGSGPTESPTIESGAIGVSTGEGGDPVVAAARNERGPEGERPDGPAKERKGKRQTARKPEPKIVSSADPVVAAAQAESQQATDPVVAAAQAEVPPADDKGDDVDE